MMQLTVTEHRESPFASTRDCVSCHMPAGSHRFDVSRNVTLLRNALLTTIARSGVDSSSVDVRLTPTAVGHAFPTGDMFRRVVVRVEVLREANEPLRPLVTRERSYGRTFALGTTKHTQTDTRLTGPTTARFALGPSARHQPIRVRVLYQRRITAPLDLRSFANEEPGSARVEDELTLAETILAPLP